MCRKKIDENATFDQRVTKTRHLTVATEEKLFSLNRKIISSLNPREDKAETLYDKLFSLNKPCQFINQLIAKKNFRLTSACMHEAQLTD
jgi:hypothetical protein